MSVLQGSICQRHNFLNDAMILKQNIWLFFVVIFILIYDIFLLFFFSKKGYMIYHTDGGLKKWVRFVWDRKDCIHFRLQKTLMPNTGFFFGSVLFQIKMSRTVLGVVWNQIGEHGETGMTNFGSVPVLPSPSLFPFDCCLRLLCLLLSDNSNVEKECK